LWSHTPQVTFSIKWDDKEKEVFKAVDNNSHHLRISQVFYNKKVEQVDLICAEQIYDRYKIKVFYTLSTYSTPQFRHHYLFANKRFFQDKSLHQAILRNLDGLWHFGDSGHYVIDIEVPPEEIDVNVHPNKTQIKFMRSDVVYSLLVTTLKTSLTKQEKTNNFPSLTMAPLPFSNEQSFFSTIRSSTNGYATFF
jgi:DNA mismatch repair protein MutL